MGSENFKCMYVNDKPWMSQYDAMKDGWIDVEDMGLRIKGDKDAYKKSWVDTKLLEALCSAVKLRALTEEAQWRMKGILSFKSAPSTNIRKIESVAIELKRETGEIGRSSSLPYKVVDEVMSSINSLEQGALAILKGENEGVFGVGAFFKPDSGLLLHGYPTVTATHPLGSASGSLREGDIVMDVDGVPFKKLTSDGTIDGAYDPATQMMRGMGGVYGSNVVLTVMRNGAEGLQFLKIDLKRNLWSAACEECAKTESVWRDQ